MLKSFKYAFGITTCVLSYNILKGNFNYFAHEDFWYDGYEPYKSSSRCNIVEEFEKLYLEKEDKLFIKNAIIYQIKKAYPGRGFRRWKQTSNCTFYKKDNVIKIYCNCE